MLNTVELELTNFINSDLTWKKVKKGCRSTNRRSRKSVIGSLNLGVELHNKSRKRNQNSSVIDYEKLGVAVLGRSFAEKVADVPIKKRKFLIRSPSPPPRTPSPELEDSLSPQPQTPTHPEGSEQLFYSQHAASGRWFFQDAHSSNKKCVFDGSVGLKFGDGVDGVWNRKMSKVKKLEHNYDDDFLGIQLLAAAACSSSSIDDDAVNVKETYVAEEFMKAEGIDSPCAAIPVKESMAPSGTGNFTQKDLLDEDNIGNLFVEDSTFAVSANLSKYENGGIVKHSAALKDERLHWDLNTVMEAWEEPYDDPLASSQMHVSEFVLEDGMHCENFTFGGCKVQNLTDAQCDTESEVQSVVCRKALSDVEGNKILLDSKSMVIATAKTSTQEDNMKECPSLRRTSLEKRYVDTPTQHATESLNYVSDTIASSHGKLNTPASVIEQIGEDSCGTSVAQNGTPFYGSFQAGNHDIFSVGMPHQKSVCGVDGTQYKICEDFDKSSGLPMPDNRTSPSQVMRELTSKMVDINNSVGESDKDDSFHPSPKGEASSSSSTSIVIREVKRRDEKVSTTESTLNDCALQIGSIELMAKSSERIVSNEGSQQLGVISQESCKIFGDSDVPTNCTGNYVPENHFSDCYGSDVTQDGHEAGVEHVTEHDTGYDSSFEDGELRETGVYSWEENELEGCETECVDYGSDDGHGDDYDAVDYSMSENLEVGFDGYQIPRKGISLLKNDDIEKNGTVENRSATEGESVTALEQCFKGDGLNERSIISSLKTKISGGDRFNEHSKHGIAEGNTDGHDDKGLLAGEFQSRASRGRFTSCSKGPNSFDVFERKNTLPLQRSRYGNPDYSYSQPERDFSFEKSMGRNRFSFKACGRNEVDGHRVNSSAGYRDTRNHYPHYNRGPDGHSYSRPRDATANSVAKVSGLNSHNDRRSINYSSNGMYRPFMRRRSSPGNGGQRGIPSVRGITRDRRSRGRSGLYAQGIRGGPKEEYPEDVPDAATVASVRRQQYFAGRERGLSPDSSSHGQFSRTCRNSRSRSRSPVAWRVQRDRSAGTRKRSPGFKSDARMEGMRPFQKPNFAADSDEIFMSQPRGRLSPQNNSRWLEDGIHMDNHFRDRNSSLRLFRRSKRFDSGDYPGRLKPDGFFRPMMHRVRFPQASGGGRGRDFDGSDDERRKQDSKYEMSHRLRRYDAGGTVRRFQYDGGEEAFGSQNGNECFSRGAIKKDIPRSGAGEVRVPRSTYNDRTYDSTLSSGLQDVDECAATREN